VSKKRSKVKHAYPLAVCIPWWSGNNAYQIWADRNPMQETPLGRGASPSLAWADAARKLKARPDGR